MSTYTFFDLVDEIFDIYKEPLSDKEIWEKAVETGLDIKVGSAGKTPWRTLGARIYVNMRDNPNSKYIKVGKRPTRFYLKEFMMNETSQSIIKKIDDKDQEEKKEREKYDERDIHPLLVKYINEDLHFKAYAKTIYHEKSKNRKKGQNEWLHPDVVGVYFPFSDYNELTIKVQKSISVNSLKLFSYELKLYLDFTNLREYYFQAVSNSSWANEGYLVCLEIKDDIELFNELQRLNSAFGIGIIKLNKDDISQSEIIFPSIEKNNMDWITIDRLISENKDFEKFMLEITEDLGNGRIKSIYDKVMFDDEMQKYLKEKGIVT